MIRHILNRLSGAYPPKDSRERELEKRIRTLEDRVRELALRAARGEKEPGPTIVVECLHIDQITVDKAELNNNFESLGIKELSGMLNIGANYGMGSRPETGNKPINKPSAPPEKDKGQKPGQGPGPKCTINYGNGAL